MCRYRSSSSGRGDDTLDTHEDCGDQVGKRLARPGSGLHDEVALVGDGVGDSLRHLSLAESRLAPIWEGADDVIQRRTNVHGVNLGTGYDTQGGSAMYPAIPSVRSFL